MGRKALILRFTDASSFVYPSFRDKVHLGGDLRVSRIGQPRIKAPEGTLDTRHVSNCLHVLANERPVPSLRKTRMKVIPELYEMARQSVVEIQMVAEEQKTMRKGVYNSYNKATTPYFLNGKLMQIGGGLLYYDRLRLFLGQELFDGFLNLLETVSGKKEPRRYFTTRAAIEFLNAHKTHPAVKEFAEILLNNQKKSVANLLVGNDKEAQSVSFQVGQGSKLNLLTTNTGIELVRKYRGCIYVPMTEEQMTRFFSKGTGVAKILEGGYVRICGIEPWNASLISKGKPTQEGEIYVPDKNS